MEGYCSKVNTLFDDKHYFCIADGEVRFYQDSSKAKLVDSVILCDKTTAEAVGPDRLKLKNFFMRSGKTDAKFTIKFDDALIRDQWMAAI